VLLEVPQRKRKAVVDANKRGLSLGEFLGQPLSNFLASPILPWAGWRQDFLRGIQSVGFVNPEALEARLGRLCAGIVDADVAFESGIHVRVFAGCLALALLQVLLWQTQWFVLFTEKSESMRLTA